MDEKHLGKALEHLHEELRTADGTDPATRETLARLRDEIDAFLAKPEPDRQDAQEPLGEAIREAVEHFEETHPRLIEVLARVADALAGMGI